MTNHGQNHPGMPATRVHIRSLQRGQDTTAFRTLNEEWISRFFALEPTDRATLGDPDTHIFALGGYILMASVDGVDVGTVALIPFGHATYELSKMAVSRHLRGLGIGRQLIEHTIAFARSIGARSLFLGSSTRLVNAVHLYESVGFQHVPPASLPGIHYSRADVFMSMTL